LWQRCLLLGLGLIALWPARQAVRRLLSGAGLLRHRYALTKGPPLRLSYTGSGGNPLLLPRSLATAAACWRSPR